MSGTRPRLLALGEAALELGDVSHVMGVINLSPESRNRGTVVDGPEAALALARSYRASGASLIDLGAQSSRYDTSTIPIEEELGRLLPSLTALVEDGFLVSVDTWKAEVARAALDAGAVMINDTGGLQDPAMREVIAWRGAAAVLMHIDGANPHRVGDAPTPGHQPEAIVRSIEERLAQIEGIPELVVDPGIAINYRGDYAAYTRLQLQVIRLVPRLHRLKRPVLIPIPRKREDHRVAAYITLALEYGADLIRVHDVEWACDLVRLFDRQPR